MSTIIAHAIRIITNDGTGNPLTYINTTIGLRSDGSFYLITGRLGLNGSKTVAGDVNTTTQKIWYEGILSDEGLTCQRQADFIDGGRFATSSSFNFNIKNTSALFATLQSNSVYLMGCRVEYYIVESSDLVTFTFTKRWTGIVREQPFNSTKYQVKCIDSRKGISSSVPIIPADETAFPKITKNSKGKMIPIAIGRVAYAPLINISESGNKVVLTINNGIESTVASASNYDGNYVLNLKTWDVVFNVDDSRLVGKYLHVISGGQDQTVKIISNTASTTGISYIAITLAEKLIVTPNPFKDGDYHNDGTDLVLDNGDDTWYFEISDYSGVLLCSTNSIYQYVKNGFGINGLYLYDDAKKDFDDISEVTASYSESNIALSAYPGLQIIALGIDENGDLNIYFPIYPTDIKLISSEFTTSDIPASAIKLFNGSSDAANYYTLTDTNYLVNKTLKLDVYLPINKVKKSWDELYLLLDYTEKYSVSNTRLLQLSDFPIDIYGYLSSVMVDGFDLQNGSLGTSEVSRYFLPGSYFNISRVDNDFYEQKINFKVSDVYSSSNKTLSFSKIRLQLDWIRGNVGATTYTLKLRQIGLIAKKSISISGDPIYANLIGEVFPSTWNSRRIAGDPIYTAADAFEHLLRDYDYDYDVWFASQPYALNEIRRPTSANDNSYYYIVTVAGTTGSSEPSWPTTIGNTVTDGTVTWKCLDQFKINESSVDALKAVRGDWLIGRSITDKKNTVDYIDELANHCFFGVYTDSNGKICTKAWREYTTPGLTFSESNIIAGTLSDIIPSASERCSNDILIKYDYNYGTQQYNKQIFITHVDAANFPEDNDITAPLTNIGSFSITAIDIGSGNWRFQITKTAHGLLTGDFVALGGNADGFDFSAEEISVQDTDTFFVDGHLTTSLTSSSGSMFSLPSNAIRWKTFVGGVRSYSGAKDLWNRCHHGYNVTKIVNKIVIECPWFIDGYAVDPSGNRIWSDLNTGDFHAAYYLAQNICSWNTLPKKQVTFEVINSSIYRALNLYDAHNFNDQKLTNGSSLLGYIHSITDLPSESASGNTPAKPARIRFGLTLNPEQLYDCSYILDTPGATNEIVDTPGATNEIVDTPC